jgi:hypothetical protein
MSILRGVLSLHTGALLALLGAAPALAQVGSSPEAGPSGHADPSQPATEVDARERDQDPDPMDGLGLSLKLGYAHQNVGHIDNPVYNAALAEAAASLPPEMLVSTGLVGNGGCSLIDRRCRTAGRDGFLLALTLHVGGDGFGWDVEPYLTSGSSAVALGMYSGPKFDIHIIDPLYVGFGFGAKLAYVWADGWQHGVDIAGRIPVRCTWYLTRSLALTLEGSFGAGVSGYVSEKQRVTDPRNGNTIGTAPKVAFGAARVWDLGVGLRFP